MMTVIFKFIAFFGPLYLLTEIYYLIKVKKRDRLNLIKIAAYSLSIVFAYAMLSIDQIQMVLVYLISTVLVVSVVVIIIKIFKIRA